VADLVDLAFRQGAVNAPLLLVALLLANSTAFGLQLVELSWRAPSELQAALQHNCVPMNG
jgi:hypothetical protein